jgi:kynurenine formamidase
LEKAIPGGPFRRAVCRRPALPMKIAGGSGGPLRIVARLPDAAD